MWFAWKYLPLWYQQQRYRLRYTCHSVVICLKISTFVVSTTTLAIWRCIFFGLWFAWKYLPLWYQQQHNYCETIHLGSCDLLENIYLCGINNNCYLLQARSLTVVICLKISTFVVSTTTAPCARDDRLGLWFAWKYLPLWYQQQQNGSIIEFKSCCDLLKNIYLCGINNNLKLS